MTCREVEELAGAYVLGALSREEAAAVREHLRHCLRHQETLDQLEAGAAVLALTPEPLAPDPQLRARVLAAVGSGGTAAAGGAREDQRPRRFFLWRGNRRRWSVPGGQRVALAGLAAAVAVLLVWNVYLQTSRPAGEGDVVARAFTGPASAQVRLMYMPDVKMMAVVLADLAPPPPDHVYQVWAMRDGTPTAVGLVTEDDLRRRVVVFSGDMTGVQAVAITVEPAGGSPQPTTAPVLQADM